MQNLKAVIELKIFLFLFLFLFASIPGYASELLVYYPSVISIKEREQVFKSEVGSTLVFGRYKDFWDTVAQEKPDVIVGPESIQSLLKEYEVAGSLQEKHKVETKYLAIALSGQSNIAGIGDKMGAIEESDREVQKNYLTKLFELAPSLATLKPKIIKTVTKPEDLFPLLVFKSVNYIVVTESIFEALKQDFKAKVTILKTSKGTCSVLIYRKKNTASGIFKKLELLSKFNLDKLGFSKVVTYGETK